MKKLTLDETWKLCLSMWRWIAKKKKNGSRLTVPILKGRWLKKHGYGEKEVLDNCFFCERSEQVKGVCSECKKDCPGAKVDEDFLCENDDYDWLTEPIAFYNKLVSLNRKRLAKKKK